VNGRYEVDLADIERLEEERARPAAPPARKPRGGYERLAERAFKMLVMGDEEGVRKLTSGLVDNGVPITEVITEMFVPSLVEVGEQWHAGRLDIATEHRCSAIVERVIGENMPTPRGRRRGTAVIAAPQGDLHSLPTVMAAAALRDDNWRVQHLGANMPAEEIVRFASREQPDLVVLTATAPDAGKSAESAAGELSELGIPALVGGAGQTLTELVESAREAKQT
jgi:methanogenic corrinoid protein MtbC1